jgi:hypothetical protein
MTSTLVSSTRQAYTNGWRTWVVPSTLLRDFVYKHKHIWQARYAPPQHEDLWRGLMLSAKDLGWRQHLALEVSMSLGLKMDATKRHLYRVMSGESQVIHAEFAEIIVMSLGMDIDRDTMLPVLPGNLRCAQELLEVRDPDFWQRPADERLHFQREIMELSREIIWVSTIYQSNHGCPFSTLLRPRRIREIQDAAPFNCLRPIPR